jgi:hypothetical protein
MTLSQAFARLPARSCLTEGGDVFGLRGFTPASVIGGVHVAPAVTKKYYVAACRACATTTVVTVRWTWNSRVDRYVYAGETGLPLVEVNLDRSQTGSCQRPTRQRDAAPSKRIAASNLTA